MTDRPLDSRFPQDVHPPLDPQIAVDNQSLPHAGSTEDRTIRLNDGETRQYSVHTPANWDGHTPLPVMYFLNGVSPGDPDDKFTGLRQEADKDGFMLVDLKGNGPLHSWNNGQGVFQGDNPNENLFLNSVHDKLSSDAGAMHTQLDGTHQGLVGFSNGGSEVYDLASKNNWVSSVQSVEGYMTGKEAPLSRPISAQIINADHDPIVPIDGTRSVDGQAASTGALDLLGPMGWLANIGIGAAQGADGAQGGLLDKLEGALGGAVTRNLSPEAAMLENFGIVNDKNNYIEPQAYAVQAYTSADQTGGPVNTQQNGDSIQEYTNTTSGATVRAVRLGTGGHSWAEEADHSGDIPGISNPNTTFPATKEIGTFFMQHGTGH